ncbi:hypothetical protein F5141DRAFT_1239107 [Pisolithus sp. B1]|nr:hypothetical protein F5141DRAFT_1239107 [Pisolithus sp. B1]
MDLPELTEDGCNWQTYGSWVLKAISEDGLMGHLDGSETRPTTLKLLQEYGARWTPRTNEERDVVTAWKTTDNVWHQRAAMAHQYIIYGLPDSILMLCMHLDTPREMFTYLENCYGQIPRPEIQKTVDEAVQQHDMPSEQYMTGESAQSTCDSDNGPENLPGGHKDPVDSPNDCAETKSGFLTPKTKVTDAQHVEPHILMVEVGETGGIQLDKRVNALKAPNERCQCMDDEVAVCRDLPESNFKAFEPVDDNTGQTGGRPTEHVPLMPIKENQCSQTHNETIANIPDPPSTHSEPSTLQIEHPTLLNSSPQAGWGDSTMAGSTVMKLERRVVSAKTAEIQAYIPHLETRPKEPDKAEDTGGGGDDTASKDILDSRRVEKTSLANSRSQQGERKTRWRNGLPAPPEMPPNGFIHPPRTLTDRYCHSRIKTDLQKLSTGQEMEQWQGSSPVPPAPPPNGTYYIHKSSKGLRHHARLKSNAENKSWQAERSMAVQNQSTWDDLPGKEDIGGSGQDDATRSGYTDSRGVKESLLTDSGDLHRRGRLKSKAESVSSNQTRHVRRVETRGYTYQIARILMRLVQHLFVPSKRSLDHAVGSWIIKVHCNMIRRTGKPETRGYTHRTAGILMQLVPSLITSMKRSVDSVGGLWMINIHYKEIRSAQQIETRGHMHRIASILMWLQQILSNLPRRFRNIANTYWREGVPSGSTRNDAKRPRNLCTAKRLPRSSGTRQDNEYRAKRPNDSPAPSKPT